MFFLAGCLIVLPKKRNKNELKSLFDLERKIKSSRTLYTQKHNRFFLTYIFQQKTNQEKRKIFSKKIENKFHTTTCSGQNKEKHSKRMPCLEKEKLENVNRTKVGRINIFFSFYSPFFSCYLAYKKLRSSAKLKDTLAILEKAKTFLTKEK